MSFHLGSFVLTDYNVQVSTPAPRPTLLPDSLVRSSCPLKMPLPCGCARVRAHGGSPSRCLPMPGLRSWKHWSGCLVWLEVLILLLRVQKWQKRQRANRRLSAHNIDILLQRVDPIVCSYNDSCNVTNASARPLCYFIRLLLRETFVRDTELMTLISCTLYYFLKPPLLDTHIYLLTGESAPTVGFCPGASFESDSSVSEGLSAHHKSALHPS